MVERLSRLTIVTTTGQERIVIIGCGDVGTQVAMRELAEGHRVLAFTRTAERADRLQARGIATIRGDLDCPETLSGLSVAGAGVYYFAPPPASARVDSRMRHFLAALTGSEFPARVVLISTSGVYGDCRGEWVSEERHPHPDSDRARRRLDAEQQLLSFGAVRGVPVVILRVPGIYGPGRLPVERLKTGEPVLREEESPWSNRVHIDDLATACLAAMRRGRSGAVYNISDGHPSTMTDYFNRVADALHLPRPPQVSRHEADVRLSKGMLSYLAESKRLDNRRMREELGVELAYPDLASGLAASIAQGER